MCCGEDKCGFQKALMALASTPECPKATRKTVEIQYPEIRCPQFPLPIADNMDVTRWICLTLALVLGTGTAYSEVYRWKDSNGVVHFGDRPHSTDPRVAKEVVVPRTNLTQGFKDTPTATAGKPAKVGSGIETNVPANPSTMVEGAKPKPAPQRGFAAQSQESCQAKKAAYRVSRACFVACGRPIVGRGHDNRLRASNQDIPPDVKKPPRRVAVSPLRDEDSAQWNCSSSVEPVSAFTLDEPPWMTVVTSSK